MTEQPEAEAMGIAARPRMIDAPRAAVRMNARTCLRITAFVLLRPTLTWDCPASMDLSGRDPPPSTLHVTPEVCNLTPLPDTNRTQLRFDSRSRPTRRCIGGKRTG